MNFYEKPLPKAPLANTSAAAVALRKAAIAFARHTAVEPADVHDRAGIALNRKLLRAAVEYAKAATDVKEKAEAVAFLAKFVNQGAP